MQEVRHCVCLTEINLYFKNLTGKKKRKVSPGHPLSFPLLGNRDTKTNSRVPETTFHN